MINRIDTRFVEASPTVDTAIYASGDLIGGKLTFNAALSDQVNTGELRAVHVFDKSKQSANLLLVLFSSDPTGTTFTDQAAFDPADADLDKIVAIISITSHAAFSDNGVSYAADLARPLKGTSRIMYGALVSAATPTYAAGTDVKVRLSLIGD